MIRRRKSWRKRKRDRRTSFGGGIHLREKLLPPSTKANALIKANHQIVFLRGTRLCGGEGVGLEAEREEQRNEKDFSLV